jgi:hypothetical protein
MRSMDENPYESPETAGLNATDSGRVQWFLTGCALLAPATWLLGRALIPPDDAALRFSIFVFAVLATSWGLFVWRDLIRTRPSE